MLDDKLNAGFMMRSSDLYHGLPTNIAAYAFLTHIVSHLVKIPVGTLGWLGSDCHLYRTQYESAERQIKNSPLPFPSFRFKKEFETLDGALALSYEDVEIVGYQNCGRFDKVEMAV